MRNRWSAPFERKDSGGDALLETKSLARGFEVKALSANGTFSGYGSVFDVVDYGYDVVVPGAFTRTIAEAKSKGRMPALLWQHDHTQIAGILTDAYEDDKGLFIEGKLALKTRLGAETYELLKMGALSGLSMGYRTVKYAWDERYEVRTLMDVDLLEMSLVTFPMCDPARIESVKHALNIKTIRNFEKFLREVGGFSHAQAKAIAMHGFKELDPREEDGSNEAPDPRDEDAAELVALIKAATTTLQSKS